MATALQFIFKLLISQMKGIASDSVSIGLVCLCWNFVILGTIQTTVEQQKKHEQHMHLWFMQ